MTVLLAVLLNGFALAVQLLDIPGMFDSLIENLQVSYECVASLHAPLEFTFFEAPLECATSTSSTTGMCLLSSNTTRMRHFSPCTCLPTNAPGMCSPLFTHPWILPCLSSLPLEYISSLQALLMRRLFLSTPGMCHFSPSTSGMSPLSKPPGMCHFSTSTPGMCVAPPSTPGMCCSSMHPWKCVANPCTPGMCR